MSKRLVGLIALFALATHAAPSWSLSCADVQSLLDQGLSVSQVEARIVSLGGSKALVQQCLATLAAPAEPVAEPVVAPESSAEEASAPERVMAMDPAPAPRPAVRSESRPPVKRRAKPRPPASQARRPVSVSTPIPTPRYDQSGSEDYTDYGVGEMVQTSTDALSTFSVDVDTASYAISRRKLRENQLPPEASVRVEEFVNAFRYDYAAPTDGRPFAVHMEAAPHPETDNRHLLRVGIQGQKRTGPRKPVHLTFLVDVSGSMSSDDKLGLAKRTLHELVDNLDSEDTIALATYAGADQIVLPPTHTTRKSEIHAAIEGLSSGGGTAMASGMEAAYQLASESYLKGSENRVIVLSDGDANIGRTSTDDILRTVKQYAEEGITLTTVGLGMGNYKDTMMEQLANKGDGNYFYVDSMKEAKKVFGQNLSGTIETIAKDVKIQVDFDPDAVRAYRLIGYENRDIADEDFRNDKVDAGEVGSGHQVTALYEIVLSDDAAGMDELATVRMRAKRPGRDSAAKEFTYSVPVGEMNMEFDHASPDMRQAWTVATFAEKLRGSPHAAEISYGEIYQYAQGADAESEDGRELLELIDRAAALSGEGSVARR